MRRILTGLVDRGLPRNPGEMTDAELQVIRSSWICSAALVRCATQWRCLSGDLILGPRQRGALG